MHIVYAGRGRIIKQKGTNGHQQDRFSPSVPVPTDGHAAFQAVHLVNQTVKSHYNYLGNHIHHQPINSTRWLRFFLQISAVDFSINQLIQSNVRQFAFWRPM